MSLVMHAKRHLIAAVIIQDKMAHGPLSRERITAQTCSFKTYSPATPKSECVSAVQQALSYRTMYF